jgi:hypothetical protein
MPAGFQRVVLGQAPSGQRALLGTIPAEVSLPAEEPGLAAPAEEELTGAAALAAVLGWRALRPGEAKPEGRGGLAGLFGRAAGRFRRWDGGGHD